MASRSIQSGTFESMDKLSLSTLKRHPKMDLNKTDLLRLLSYLEGELQARDISIAALKTEKAKQLLYQAKYGRFGLGDPFNALQRDSDCQKDNSFNETAVKAMYDNQLAQLENLIDTQRKAQQRMREQLASVEKRYHKVCAELEDEKRKHAQDTAQGDDVTYMLEKDRERLKQEVDFEKSQVKKGEKEVKKLTASLEEEQAASSKHKAVALMLIKERRRMLERLVQLEQVRVHAKQLLHEERVKAHSGEGRSLEQRCAQAESERKQTKAALVQEEKKNASMTAEVSRLEKLVEALQRQVSSQASSVASPDVNSVLATTNCISSMAPGVKEMAASQISRVLSPVLGRANAAGVGASPLPPRKVVTPVSVTQTRVHQMPNAVSKPVGGGPVKLPINKGVAGVSSTIRHTVAPSSGIKVSTERPVPAEKPAELSTQRVNVISSGGTTVLSNQPGTPTVFTTPSGTRISLNVSPSPGTTRRSSGAGRGVPPPVPPNKPLVYIPTSPVPRPTAPFQHQGAPTGGAQSISPGSGASPRPQTPPKFGITILKDQVTLASSGGVSTVRPKNSSSQRFVSATTPSTNSSGVRPAATPGGDTLVIRKPSQSSSPCDVSPPEGATVAPVAANVDNFRQADLSPDFPVSVATAGSCEGNASSVASSSLSSSSSSVTSSSSSLHPPNVFIFPLHKYASEGDVNTLVTHLHTNGISNVNWPMPDGSTAVHLATLAGNTECLQVLLENGGDCSAVRNDQSTPVHLAASGGHLSCLSLLLLQDGKVDTTDQSGWTPLHFSSMNGHTDCCLILLENGARLDAVTTSRWTPLHCLVHAGHIQCLKAMLQTAASDQYSLLDHRSLCNIINMTDNDGWSAVHLAAIRDNADCLQLLAAHCDFDHTTVLGVASQQCRTFLDGLDDVQDELCSIHIELPPNTHLETSQCIGQVAVNMETTWSELEERLSSAVMTHISAVTTGMRTKRTSWLEQDLPPPSAYSLGLTLDSVRSFCIGQHSWSPGTPAAQFPYEVLNSYHTHCITVQLFGLEDGCLDALAYESFIPVSLLQTYLRLVEQHKNLMFVGPGGTGKTYLARKLAESIRAKQEQCGNTANIHFVPVSETFTRMNLISLLIETGCLLPASQPVPRGHSPILVFDDLGKVNISEVFKDILPAIESRGLNNLLHITLGGEIKSCNLTGNCYIIGSVNRARYVCLDPSVQQRFHWVHFRNDQEPIRGLLQRHLYRQLVHSHSGVAPPSDNPVFRVVEWVICVWLRLSEGVHKLGLADGIKFGPTHLMSCPVKENNAQAVLRWLCQLWNHMVVPAVTRAVVLGSSGATVDVVLEEHRKVASRAVYVLTQKAVVSGCPLTDQEKDCYLASFQGSSEHTTRASHDTHTPSGGKQQVGVGDTVYVTRTVTTDEDHTAPCRNDNRNGSPSGTRRDTAIATVAMAAVAMPPDSVHLKSFADSAKKSATAPSGGSDSISHTSVGKTVGFTSTVPSFGNVVFALSGIPSSRAVPSPTGSAVRSHTSTTITAAPSDLVMLPGTLFRVTQTSSIQNIGADKLFPAGDKLQHLPNFKGSFEREVVVERQLAVQVNRSRLPDGQGGSRREWRSCSPEVLMPSRQLFDRQEGSAWTGGQAGRLQRSCSPEIMSCDRQVGEGRGMRESPPKSHKDAIPW